MTYWSKIASFCHTYLMPPPPLYGYNCCVKLALSVVVETV